MTRRMLKDGSFSVEVKDVMPLAPRMERSNIYQNDNFSQMTFSTSTNRENSVRSPVNLYFRPQRDSNLISTSVIKKKRKPTEQN